MALQFNVSRVCGITIYRNVTATGIYTVARRIRNERHSLVISRINSVTKFIQNFTRGSSTVAPDISLISGTSMENMDLCYDVARVQAYVTTSAIRLVIRIPLRGADRVMILFRSTPLPTYLKVLKNLYKFNQRPYT